jgi:hypothetical protein
MAMLNNQMVCPQQVGEFNMKLFHCQYLLVMIIPWLTFRFKVGPPVERRRSEPPQKSGWINYGLW